MKLIFRFFSFKQWMVVSQNGRHSAHAQNNVVMVCKCEHGRAAAHRHGTVVKSAKEMSWTHRNANWKNAQVCSCRIFIIIFEISLKHEYAKALILLFSKPYILHIFS